MKGISLIFNWFFEYSNLSNAMEIKFNSKVIEYLGLWLKE